MTKTYSLKPHQTFFLMSQVTSLFTCSMFLFNFLWLHLFFFRKLSIFNHMQSNYMSLDHALSLVYRAFLSLPQKSPFFSALKIAFYSPYKSSSFFPLWKSSSFFPFEILLVPPPLQLEIALFLYSKIVLFSLPSQIFLFLSPLKSSSSFPSGFLLVLHPSLPSTYKSPSFSPLPHYSPKPAKPKTENTRLRGTPHNPAQATHTHYVESQTRGHVFCSSL